MLIFHNSYYLHEAFYFRASASICHFQRYGAIKCRPVTMSAIDSSRSLLGHDDVLPIQRPKEDISDPNFNRRHRIWSITHLLISLTSLLITLTIFFILGRQWHAEFEAPGPAAPTLSGHLDSTQEPGHERNLKWLLHPEDHVSRAPGIRHFSWNITKATIAPNGVKKDVFLINGTINFHPKL